MAPRPGGQKPPAGGPGTEGRHDFVGMGAPAVALSLSRGEKSVKAHGVRSRAAAAAAADTVPAAAAAAGAAATGAATDTLPPTKVDSMLLNSQNRAW